MDNRYAAVAPWIAFALFVILAAVAVSGSFAIIPESVNWAVDILATIP